MTTAATTNVTLNNAALQDQAKPMWKIVLSQFFEHRLAVASLFVILLFVGIAVGADAISHFLNLDPDAQDILARYAPWSHEHWLGTDEIGRDAFIRLIYGARVSMSIAALVALSSTMIGIAIGAYAGYFGGFIDTALMRLTDSLLALPMLPIMIIMSAMDFGKLPLMGHFFQSHDSSILKMVIILVFSSWMMQARLVRGEVLSIKEREFSLAAKTTGMSSFGIIIKEILPNVISPVIVSVTLNIGSVILTEAALSFLGLGIQPPTPSWGNMLNNAREIIYNSPSLAIIPGLLILIVVMAFNFLGDGLQDALDPKAIRR